MVLRNTNIELGHRLRHLHSSHVSQSHDVAGDQVAGSLLAPNLHLHVAYILIQRDL